MTNKKIETNEQLREFLESLQEDVRRCGTTTLQIEALTYAMGEIERASAKLSRIKNIDVEEVAKIVQRELAFPWGEDDVMSVVKMEDAVKTAQAILDLINGGK